MPATAENHVAQYPTPMGLVFIFNLIVGTGALAMPKAFQDAGYVFGLVTIAISAVMSYITLTFVMESMSAANAVLESQRAGKLKVLAIQFASENPTLRSRNLDNSSSTGLLSSSNSPHVPPVTRPQFFEITQRVEFGRMASMFLNPWGVRFFYLCLVIYLYGDLAIYATAVPKSMMNVVCTYRPHGDSPNGTLPCASAMNVTNDDPCWASAGHFWTRITVYRFFVAAFALLIGPWVFFNVSKTKYLQTFSTVSRWIAFLLMISLATSRLIRGTDDLGHPPMARVTNFGTLFGICVYAFMCHHSLPSVVTPMRSKNHIYALTAIVYVLILSFYVTLSTTGAFAFGNVMDVYTLNFLQQCNSHGPGDSDSTASHVILLIVEYFLALFPVFTLSMTFPVIGITLRNNIQTLLFPNYYKAKCGKKHDDMEDNEEHSALDPSESNEDSEDINALVPVRSAKSVCQKLTHSVVVPCFVLLVPFTVALVTDNVEILTSITGSYAGVGVQYVMPSLLIYGVRKRLPHVLGSQVPSEYGSPFRRTFWVYLLFIWAGMTVLVVTINHILEGI